MSDIDRNRELVRNSAKCLLCSEEIESKHRHDFRSCRCGNIAVDGGIGRSGYWRRVGGVEGDPGVTWADTSIFVGDPGPDGLRDLAAAHDPAELDLSGGLLDDDDDGD